MDTVFDMPGVVLRQVPGLMVLKTVVVPQLQFIAGVDISFVAQRQRFHCRSYLMVDVPVMRAVQSLRCCRGEDIRAPPAAAR